MSSNLAVISSQYNHTETRSYTVQPIPVAAAGHNNYDCKLAAYSQSRQHYEQKYANNVKETTTCTQRY